MTSFLSNTSTKRFNIKIAYHDGTWEKSVLNILIKVFTAVVQDLKNKVNHNDAAIFFPISFFIQFSIIATTRDWFIIQNIVRA